MISTEPIDINMNVFSKFYPTKRIFNLKLHNIDPRLFLLIL